MQLSRNSFRAMFDGMTHDAYWVPLKDSTHCDFNETPWFDSPPSPTLTRRALVQDRYVVSFFRKHLRNEDDHLLDAPSADYPEVDGFLRK
jgi:hypothetical protein